MSLYKISLGVVGHDRIPKHWTPATHQFPANSAESFGIHLASGVPIGPYRTLEFSGPGVHFLSEKGTFARSLHLDRHSFSPVASGHPGWGFPQHKPYLADTQIL